VRNVVAISPSCANASGMQTIATIIKMIVNIVAGMVRALVAKLIGM
jgi:hypothetical protein